MKLEQLRYFVAVAKHTHIGKAANEVAISPSAISHSINALEEEFGRKLLVRKGRHISLTADGYRLVDYAEQLLLQSKELIQAMLMDNHELQGHYRLAASHGYCERVLTPVWLQLQNRSPKLSAEIFSLRSHDVVQKVIAGEVDMGLCLCPRAHPELHEDVLREEYLVIVVNTKHPILNLPKKDQIAALQDYPFAASKAFYNIENCETHPIIQSLNMPAKRRLLFDSYNVALEALRHSEMWTLLPESVWRWHRDQTATIEYPHESMRINISLVTHQQIKTGVMQALSEGLSTFLSNNG